MEYDIRNIVSDEELFVEEISEQIEKRLRRLKKGKELTKSDLVKPKVNEDSLFKKQLEYVYKVGKQFEAMSYRNDIRDNQDMYKEVKEAIRKNNERKKRLLEECKPSIDYDYLRLI